MELWIFLWTLFLLGRKSGESSSSFLFSFVLVNNDKADILYKSGESSPLVVSPPDTCPTCTGLDKVALLVRFLSHE